MIVAGAVAIAICAPLFTLFYRLNSLPVRGAPWLRRLSCPLVVTIVLVVLVAVVLGPGLRLG